MNKHSLKILEYNKIISLIKGKCLTPYGNGQINQIKPVFVKKEIIQKQTEITQLKDIINFGLPFPLYRLDDSREILQQTKVVDIFLEPKEILKVIDIIKVSIELYKYDKDGREKFPFIDEYLKQVRAFPELKVEIERAISEDGEIKDTASKALRNIRAELNSTRSKITTKLSQILSKQIKQPGWQDDVVTVRNDRYVISIPTSKYESDMGILHDRSQTGATLFVEPKETVELNNKVSMLHQQEHQEIVKILKALTAEIGSRSESLLENCRIIGILDAIHACASFSNDIDGHQPVISDEPNFDFIDVKHPLLMVQFEDQKKVIPNSINLDDNRQAILITGPNTGGKTIVIKTVGLSVLMAQSGLHISADEKSEVGIFHDIFADIGDEQSIELSLSTFSSHITNIIEGLNGANGNSLLLYDEIGAGTDPKEGSALAESIILNVLDKGARMIVTTHYSQLKTLAMEYPQLENASLEFNRETLAPTFKLRIGLPGSSYAVEIAGRLGMPEEICKRASSLLSSGEKSLDKLIKNLEEELKVLKSDKIEMTDKLAKASELETFYRTQVERLTNEVETEKKKALQETLDYLVETRREMEYLVKEIRDSQASEKSVKEFHRKLKEREKGIENIQKKFKTEKPDHTVYKSGDAVEIISMRQKGEIDQLIGNNKAKIKVGNMFTTVELRNLKKVEAAAPQKQLRKSKYAIQPDEKVEREIHLRGMTVDEAMENLDKFLDRAIINGLNQVYVIHGKGAGILRKTLTAYLHKHNEVASVRLGDFNEGGAGVSVVKLKE